VQSGFDCTINKTTGGLLGLVNYDLIWVPFALHSLKTGPLGQFLNEFGGVKPAPRPTSQLIRRPFEVVYWVSFFKKSLTKIIQTLRLP
jgi:hypothetical protein